MKKLTILAAGLLLLVPSPAFSDSFQLRLGYFMPSASTNIGLYPDSLWAIELDQMSFNMEDFRGSIMGLGYEYFLGRNFSLAVTLDSYSKSRLGYYNDYVFVELDEGYFAFPYELYYGDDILHSFKVSSTPLQLSFKLAPLGRKARLIPFVGGGAGLYFWSVRMYGEMVDFGDPRIYPDEVLGEVEYYPVTGVNAKESGAAFGAHAFAGFQIPVGYRATIEAEARYHWAKAQLNELFSGFDAFDLGGLALSVGFSYWF